MSIYIFSFQRFSIITHSICIRILRVLISSLHKTYHNHQCFSWFAENNCQLPVSPKTYIIGNFRRKQLSIVTIYILNCPLHSSFSYALRTINVSNGFPLVGPVVPLYNGFR